MIRLRAAAALTAVLVPLLAACSAPLQDPTTEGPVTSSPDPAGQGRTDDTAAAAPRADDAHQPGTTPSDAGELSDLVTIAAVDPALGHGHDVSGAAIATDAAAAARAEGSQVGAELTATLFVAAWNDALNTGDGAQVRALSLESCTYCAAVVEAAQQSTVDPTVTISTTLWPVTSWGPSEDPPHSTVVAGIELVAVRAGDPTAAEALEIEVVDHRLQLVQVTTAWVEGAWWVRSVVAEPWDGSDPLSS
ncbi:hypothetical protein [Actinotalea sp. Marseille-Q4924]|uniref:hypothetical protein n=1 Tax=Actinotalea sp. Marseille-Q4924 TaxID=2866571 RepID=UPI001CE4400D|nr:hypothetical protein [Actinotalea sp. Marseille-Q4924]